MGEQHYLVGAEDVRRASNTMSNAAENMRSAASEIDGSMDRFKNFMEDWLQRFEAAVEKANQTPQERRAAVVADTYFRGPQG